MKLKNFFLSCSSASRSRKLKDEQQRFTAGNSRPGSGTSGGSGGQPRERPMSPTTSSASSLNGGSGVVKETDLADFVQDHPKKSLSAAYSYGSNGSKMASGGGGNSGRIPGYYGSSSSLSAAAAGGGKHYHQTQNKRALDSRSGRHRERSAGRDNYQYYQHQNGYHQHNSTTSSSAQGASGGERSFGNSRFYDDCYHHHHHNHTSSHNHNKYNNQHSHAHQSQSSNNNKTSPATESGHHSTASLEDDHYRRNGLADLSRSPDNLGVKKGDRVVWFREPPETNESGVIKWTGIIEGEEIAGIEFDRPLGLGSGWYKNKQLFTCSPQRGGLVAVAGLILEDDYFFNPVISTKDPEDVVVPTGGEISPIRGDSSLSASSGIGSGSGIHSSPSPSPSSSSSTSLDVGSYDTSSNSSTSSRNRPNQRYPEEPQQTAALISVSKDVVSNKPKYFGFSQLGQGDACVSANKSGAACSSGSNHPLPVVDCGDGPVAAGRVSEWTISNNGSNSSSSYTCPPKTSEIDQTDNNKVLVNNNNGNTPEDSNMPIPFVQAPLREEDAERISGRSKGIQGHRNSCYLDATLFAMFSFSGVFDSILLQEWNNQKNDGDEELARNVQRILRDDVVNPLRKELYCTARNVMKLRETMQHLDDKLTSEEMDPQEFLQLLFCKVLNLDEFMSLSSGHSDFFHQVLVAQTEEDKNKIPTIQQLFEQSLIMQELKLKTVPRPALILQMPRSGNKYKMYDGILPNLCIDITDLMEDIPRMCIICGTLATHECPSCYGKFSSGGEARDISSTPEGSGAESTAFCETCLQQIHKRRDRQSHKSHIVPIKYSFDASQYFSIASSLSPTSATSHHHNHHLNHHLNNTNNTSGAIPSYHFGASGSWATSGGSSGTGGGFAGGNPNFNRNPSSGPLISSIPSPSNFHGVSSSRTIPRVTMDLFAVICIETSHFVSFVKCGTERSAPWVFFDSMADRVENPNGTGHNIPQVKLLPRMGYWLEELEKSPRNIKDFMSPDSNMAPELRRLLSDPYICLYYSPQTCMYS